MAGTFTSDEAEFNVRLCPVCFRRVVRAPWRRPVRLAPMETAGRAVLRGASLDTWLRGVGAGPGALVSSWVSWCIHNSWFDCVLSRQPGAAATDPFYDPVAVGLSSPTRAAADFAVTRTRLAVLENGTTVLVPSGTAAAAVATATVDVAVGWSPGALASFLLRLAAI